MLTGKGEEESLSRLVNLLKLHWVSICRFVFFKKRNEKGKKEEGRRKEGRGKIKLNGFVTECEKQTAHHSMAISFQPRNSIM